jgi:Arm DNA-binding domain
MPAPCTDAPQRPLTADGYGSERPYKLGDSRGLYLLVTPSGGKWWRFDYRFGGKRKRLSTGTYPDVALKEARGRRDSSREHLAHGGHRCVGRSPVMETHYAAMTDPKAMGALLRAIDGYRGDLPTRCACWRRLRSFDPRSCAMRNGASSIWTRPSGISPHENPRASPGAVVTPGSRVPAGAVSPDRTVAVCLPRRAVGGAAPAHLAERRDIMQRWADYLDGLKNGADVVPLRARLV